MNNISLLMEFNKLILHTETISDSIIKREWNFCHPSGYAGRVLEYFDLSLGQLKREFTTNGEWHKETAEGPAYERFYANGSSACRQFWINGSVHRPSSEGPACEGFFENGRKSYQEFFFNGRRHRDPAEGPAWIVFLDDGDDGLVVHREFFVHGERVDHKDTLSHKVR